MMCKEAIQRKGRVRQAGVRGRLVAPQLYCRDIPALDIQRPELANRVRFFFVLRWHTLGLDGTLMFLFLRASTLALLCHFNLFIILIGRVASTPALDRKSTRLNSSHSGESRMPSSA